MPGGIKELVADVEVKATDIGASAVTTAKLGDSAVTLQKINRAVGVWKGFAVTTTAATVTTAFRTVLSGNLTVLACVVDITTAVTAASSLTISDTAGNDMVAFPHASAIKTTSTLNMTAATTVNSLTITSGNTLKGVLSNTSDKFKANVYLLTIETPS
jgi:hypothetical protein